MPEISIVVPCFNEADNLPLLLRALEEELDGEDFEVILVDDGSSDDTEGCIRKISRTRPNVHGLIFSRNFGHQPAVKAGMDHAQGECVITMDADLEHPPATLKQMLSNWREGFDVVQAKRRLPAQFPRFKKWTAALFYCLINRISETHIEPNCADFRLLDRKVLKVCQSIREHDLFWRGLVPWLGFRQKILEYPQGQRQHGQSGYTLSRMIRLSIAGITGFSTKPLQLGIAFGALCAGGAFAYFGYALYAKVFTDSAVSGWTSVIASVLLIGGVQTLLLGIMGLYLGRMFIESKGRPQYIIREVLRGKTLRKADLPDLGRIQGGIKIQTSDQYL